MKEITEIEKLGLEELERIASDTSVKVPTDLKASLELLADEELSPAAPSPKRPALRRVLPWVASVAAVLVAGVIILSVQSQPKDTYSDPYLAYAEVQRTFARIAGDTVPVVEKTGNIIDRVIK